VKSTGTKKPHFSDAAGDENKFAHSATNFMAEKSISDKKSLLPLSAEMRQSLFDIAECCLMIAMSFAIVAVAILCLKK
jgi:hypothetical protein